MAARMDQAAPDFSLKNQHGQTVQLSDFHSSKRVLLVFYPFAFSSVCTGELCEIRDQLGDLADENTEILAVSCDHMFSLRAFADRDGYTFSLLSDFWPHGEVAKAYGIFEEGPGCAGRATFIIDSERILRWSVHNEIPDARDLGEYRKVLAEIS